MNKNKKLIPLTFLLSLLVVTSCNNLSSSNLDGSEDSLTTSETPTIPLDYELDLGVNNFRGGAYYEIFVRSFADSDGDGIGDLKGVTSKLSYLKDLGIGGIWLMPIHPSPSYHGYDVEDYKAISEDYGTIEDFDELIEEASKNDIDVIIDLVINHSSSTHPWFKEGLENFKNGNFSSTDFENKANWYNFKWENGKVVYEAGFGDWMPDLNLDNPRVRDEIESIIKFWIDHGVSGFRLDAVTYYYPLHQDSIDFLEWFDTTVKSYKEDAYIVGEAWKDEDTITMYYRGIDSLFNFKGANSGGYIIDNITYRTGNPFAFQLAQTYEKAYSKNPNAKVATFLTNHDMDRSSQMYVGIDTELRQKLAASLYLLTPGVPFLYYGEEIGLKGTRGSAQTDANRRLPMVWQRGEDPMRPNPPPGTTYPAGDQVKEGVYNLLDVPFSLLNHYKKVLNVRNQYPWLVSARVQYITVGKNAIAALKFTDKDNQKNPIYVLHNFIKEDVEIDLSRLSKDEELVIAHDIFTQLKRTTYSSNTTILLPGYSSVVLEEK